DLLEPLAVRALEQRRLRMLLGELIGVGAGTAGRTPLERPHPHVRRTANVGLREVREVTALPCPAVVAALQLCLLFRHRIPSFLNPGTRPGPGPYSSITGRSRPARCRARRSPQSRPRAAVPRPSSAAQRC